MKPKQPSRVKAGHKAKNTRKLNQARAELWSRFKADCIERARLIPSILPHSEGGVELMYDRGYGIIGLKFNSRVEAIDWIATLC